MPDNNLNIRTKEIDEILGKAPSSIVRWGLSLFFVITVSLLFGSYYIKYPKTIQSKLSIIKRLDSVYHFVSYDRIIQHSYIRTNAGKMIGEKGDTLYSYYGIENSISKLKYSVLQSRGEIRFYHKIEMGEVLKSGDLLYSIVDSLDYQLSGTIDLPLHNYDIVKIGQVVLLEPFANQMGLGKVLHGEIVSIAFSTDNKSLKVMVNVSNKELSKSEKGIWLKGNLETNADIVISKERLIFKIITPLRGFL